AGQILVYGAASWLFPVRVPEGCDARTEASESSWPDGLPQSDSVEEVRQLTDGAREGMRPLIRVPAWSSSTDEPEVAHSGWRMARAKRCVVPSDERKPVARNMAPAHARGLPRGRN